jgi:hypothetical protein
MRWTGPDRDRTEVVHPCSRKANKVYFDQHKRLQPDGDQQLHEGDLVLRLDSQKFKSGKPARAAKLDDRWLGPYRIREVAENSTFYYLEELDTTPLAESVAGDRLKKFFSRDQRWEDRAEQLEHLRTQQIATAERQARSSNPARLRELLGMIEDARNLRNDEREEDEDGHEGDDDGEEEGDV